MSKQLLVVLLLLTLSLALSAQQLGILRGVVTDESGVRRWRPSREVR